MMRLRKLICRVFGHRFVWVVRPADVDCLYLARCSRCGVRAGRFTP